MQPHHVQLGEARIRRALIEIGDFLHSSQKDLVYRRVRLEALDPLVKLFQTLSHLMVEVKRLIAHRCGCYYNDAQNG